MADLTLVSKLVEVLERPKATFARFGKFTKVLSVKAQPRPSRSARWSRRGPAYMVSVDGMNAPRAVHHDRNKAEGEAAVLALRHQKIARVLVVADVIIPVGGHMVMHGDVLCDDWRMERWESREEIAAKEASIQARIAETAALEEAEAYPS